MIIIIKILIRNKPSLNSCCLLHRVCCCVTEVLPSTESALTVDGLQVWRCGRSWRSAPSHTTASRPARSPRCWGEASGCLSPPSAPSMSTWSWSNVRRDAGGAGRKIAPWWEHEGVKLLNSYVSIMSPNRASVCLTMAPGYGLNFMKSDKQILHQVLKVLWYDEHEYKVWSSSAVQKTENHPLCFCRLDDRPVQSAQVQRADGGVLQDGQRPVQIPGHTGKPGISCHLLV